MKASILRVLVDNRHSAILIRQGYKYVHPVALNESALTVTRLTEEQFEERGFRPIDYSLARAISRFLCHSAGVGGAARAALLTVLDEESGG
jgi:hypothetical protein